MPEYPQNNSSSRPQGRGGRNRRRRPGGPNNHSNNSGHAGPRDRSAQPRREKQAPATGFQKFLHKVTFGVLGKPGEKPSTSASSYRAEPQRTPRTDRPERKPSGNEGRPPRENRPPRQSQHTSSEVTGEKLYVGNLSYDASESDLFELFNGSGKVKNAEVVVNSRTQRSKGFAFVTMMTIEDAKKAVADLNGKEFMGRPLVVGGAKPMPEREERPARREAPVADDDVIRPPAEDEEEAAH